MPAYLIASIRIYDVDRYEDYAANVPALIARHGGEYLVRGGDAEVLEGQWKPDRLVVIKFPDRGAALAFYEDLEYAPLKALRQAITESSVVVADGLA